MRVIVFLGYGGAGKTEALTRVCGALAREGHSVGALKHVHDPSLEFEKKGKDSWRYAKAGADLVVAASDTQVASLNTLKGKDRPNYADLRTRFEASGVDYLLVEGFFSEDFSPRARFIICASNYGEARDLLSKHGGKKVSFITGRLSGARRFKGGNGIEGIPIVDLKRRSDRQILSLLN